VMQFKEEFLKINESDLNESQITVDRERVGNLIEHQIGRN